jgi:integrase
MAATKVTLRNGQTRWKERVWVYDVEKRKRVKKELSEPTRKALADEKHRLRETEKRRKRGLPEEQGPLTYDELCERYLAQYSGTAESKTTLEYNLGYSRGTFKSVLVRELLAESIGAWLNALEARTGKPLSPVSRGNALKAMRQVLNAGVTWRYLAENPARAVAIPAPDEDGKHPFESWAEVFAVADAIGSFYRPLVIFACATGLRPQEWQALHRNDIDRTARTASVRRTVRGGAIIEGKAKTPGSLRKVQLQQIALDTLPAFVLTPLTEDQLVFPSKQGKLLNLHSWRAKTWKKALDDAELEYREPYAMRDTFATLSLAAGAPIEWVAKQLGHVDRHGNPRVSTTLKHYAKFLPEVDQRNLGVLDAFAASSMGSGRKVDGTADGAREG